MNRTLLGVVGVATATAIGVGVWLWLANRDAGPPPGFAQANGRVEATRVDVALKFGGRIAEVLAVEGAMVAAGDVVARIEATELEATLRAAEAATRQARQQEVQALALIAQREGELTLARAELGRAQTLLERGYATAEEFDLRQMEETTAVATLNSAVAARGSAQAAIEAAQARVAALRADLADHVLTAPRAGRVQYRLAEPGEVLATGGRVVSLLDIGDVYMDIYLPTSQAGRLAMGAEARLKLDAAPEFVIPAEVSFVAAAAQFTPKYVETESEREKLMFRVRLKIPGEVLTRYHALVKTGLPGVAVVRIAPEAVWPEALAVKLP
jgi:HlyD family secretion protein